VVGFKVTPPAGGDAVDAELLFNVCGIRTSPIGCPDDLYSVGYIKYDGKCYALSQNKGNFITEWSYDAFNPINKDEDGLKVTGKNQGSQGNIPFDITFAFKCDDKVDGDPAFSISQPDTNRISILVNHKKACGLDFFGPFGALVHYKYALLFVGIVLGVCMCFFGFRIFNISLAILGFCVG
jgi:hypothetical protein